MKMKPANVLIPFFPFILIIVGLLKTITFYSFFGININDYISLSEVLILFADSVTLLLFFTFLPFIVLMVVNVDPSDNPFGHDSKLTNSKPSGRKWLKNAAIIFPYIVLAMCLIGFVIGNYIIKVQLIVIFFFLVFLLVIKSIYSKYYNGESKKVDPAYFMAATMFVLCVGLLIFLELPKAGAVYHGRYNGSVIVTNDSTYVSNSSQVYVGKTESYVYMYDRILSAPIIIPVSEVKKITIRSWRNQ